MRTALNIHRKRGAAIMFDEKIKSFVGRIIDLKENIFTEEATKTSLIMPFFAMLGYDIFNPMEFEIGRAHV